MAIEERGESSPSGFLLVEGVGGLTVREMREVLSAFEDGYGMVSRAEALARHELDALRTIRRWRRRYGPPELFGSLLAYRAWPRGGGVDAMSGPSRPMVVWRVVLQSPGFWEFAASLNPLEVLRQYLNDRHERRKDREYRSRAEADRLAIENAAARLSVLRSYLELQREYADELHVIEGLQEQIVGAIRPALERLGEMDDRGLIDGGTARAGREPLDAPEA